MWPTRNRIEGAGVSASKAFRPDVIASTFGDDHGWIPNPLVRTKQFAIPYAHYAERGRLELWARKAHVEALIDTA